MKGISLMSDVFLIFALLSITVILTTIIWVLIIVHEAESRLFIASPRNVELRLFTMPLEYETTLLAFLEFEKDGIKMKKLLEAAAIQHSTTVWVDGKTVDVKAASDEFLQPIINKDYVLRICCGSLEVKISEFVKSTSLPVPLPTQKASAELFLLDGKTVNLQLFVKG
jgi:hypothetical protein